MRCESELSGQGAFESKQVRPETWSADFSQAAEFGYFLTLSRRFSLKERQMVWEW